MVLEYNKFQLHNALSYALKMCVTDRQVEDILNSALVYARVLGYSAIKKKKGANLPAMKEGPRESQGPCESPKVTGTAGISHQGTA